MNPIRRRELIELRKRAEKRREAHQPKDPNIRSFRLGVAGYGLFVVSATSLEEAKRIFKETRKGDYSIDQIQHLELENRPDGSYSEEQLQKMWAERSLTDSNWYASSNGDETLIGPRGGRYRINSNGRKSYDVP